MWTCIEDRVEKGELFDRPIRKIIFGTIYADRMAETPILIKRTLANLQVSNLTLKSGLEMVHKNGP